MYAVSLAVGEGATVRQAVFNVGFHGALDPDVVTPVIADFTVSPDGGMVAVSNAKPGLRYTIEACDSLAGGWRTVESRTTAKGADIVFTVDGSAGRFFRVIVTDP